MHYAKAKFAISWQDMNNVLPTKLKAMHVPAGEQAYAWQPAVQELQT
jgi:hypothetical protein